MPDPNRNYFQAIPWCAKILDDSAYTTLPLSSRHAPKGEAEDTLFSETFKTDQTIRECLVFYPRPTPDASRLNEVHMFFAMGDGLNGFPHVLHGGVVATLFDEVMGMLFLVNKKLYPESTKGDGLTAYLTVEFLKPVMTPHVYFVTTWFREVKGRKYYIDSTLKDEGGAVLAKAESLYIGVQKTKEKL